MRRIAPKLRPLLIAGLLLTAGCDRGPAELIREVDAAREGCTEEKLKAGAEECVRMMERYAEMGTEVIEGYIGAVKSLDRALRRMPPAQFDTAGVGRALSVPEAAGPAGGGSSARARGVFPSSPPFSGGGGDRGADRAWGSPARPRDPWSDAAPGYGGAPHAPGDAGWYGGDPRHADPRYAEPRHDDLRYGDLPYGDPRGAAPRYGDSRYGDPRYGDPRYGDPRYGDPRYANPRVEAPRYGDPRDADPAPYGDPYAADRDDPWGAAGDPDRRDVGEGRRDGRPVDPRPAPPARGRLLPPEERLRRPWLEEAPATGPGAGRIPPAEWRDTVVRRR